MKKRMMGLLLSTVMISSLLTGCGGGASDNSAGSGSSQTGGSQTAAVSELKGPGNVELSFLGQSLDFDPNADVMAGAIEEKTGYKVNYSMLPSDSPDEKLIADVAGGVKYDIIHFIRREMLDFTAFPVFFVSNLLLVQRKKYYFNRATVSRNCSIVL